MEDVIIRNPETRKNIVNFMVSYSQENNREASVREIGAAGYAVGNVDATVICERPKLRPYIDAMRDRIAECLGVPVSCVSVKGKTNEGMDAVGEGRGIVVHAVALLRSGEG